MLKGTDVDPRCLAKAEAKFAKAITKAERKVPCLGTAVDLDASVDACVADLVAEVPPCAGSGVSVGGACWYLGPPSGICGGGFTCNCDQLCGAVGLVYDSATETYAGSGRTQENCTEVLGALGVTPPDASDDDACTMGLGCYYANGAGYGCTSPATESSAFNFVAMRACACH